MKKNNKILFLVDHKHRDLPSLALIGYMLKNKGYIVKYIALWQELPVIKSFDPAFIVLPKPFYNNIRLFRWKIHGRKLIVIHTEGNFRNRMKERIEITPDLYFFWNKNKFDEASSTLAEKGGLAKLIGCARTDFLHENLNEIFSTKESLLKRFELDPNNKTITIATSTSYGFLTRVELKSRYKTAKRVLKNDVDYDSHMNNDRELIKKTVEIIKELSKKYKDLNIALKPHPNENIVFWRDLIESLQNDNAKLIIGEPINNLLRISDFHIAHNSCTTTFEARIMGIPAIEIWTENTESISVPSRLELANYTIKSFEELDLNIQRELFDKNVDPAPHDKNNEKLIAYTNKFYFKFDGLRCLEHAEEIDKYIKDCSIRSTSYIALLIKQPRYFKMLSSMLFETTKSLVKKSLKLFKFNKKTLKESSETNSNLDSRGRFDNRIKSGDEERWFKKFESVGINFIQK